jgi:hypothetical protein
LPVGFVSATDWMVPSLTVILTGAFGRTFLAPAAGRSAILAAGFGAAWTVGFSLAECGADCAAPALPELHAASPSSATAPSAASSRPDHP